MKIESLLDMLAPPTSSADRALVERAYRAAEQAHAGQVRVSGEAYINHCLAVAAILADLHMPAPVVAAGLLHDSVEDTSLTLDQIEHDFGSEVRRLVDGVTKLKQLPRVSRDDADEPGQRSALASETLRKTFLAMGEDVRVVIIKLADRLHNMRTIRHLPEDRQRRIARETLDIFAPLASRLGIWQMKWELEDLGFRYVDSVRYREIASLLDERRPDREATLQEIIERLQAKLGDAHLEADLTGRPKHIFSIHRKMERKGVQFDQVYDVRGVRVIVKDIPSCYVALGVIHNLWKPIPGEFDDYIATPKDNFYQSLHTAVVYDDGKTLEVQIRTPEMHESAEYGIAAHWRYKEGAKRDEAYERRIRWLRSLMEWRQEVTDASAFVDAMKSDVLEERVYAFTPHGDIIDLPGGATPIDFAYHVHTSVGERCRGAKVNGKLVGLDYQLKTGDQVEILVPKRGGPSRDWMNPDLGLVKSQRALSKIRQYFKKQDREQNIVHGREMLERELKRLGVEDQSFEQLAKAFGFAKVDDFLAALGYGDLHTGQVVSRLVQLVEPPALPAVEAVKAPAAQPAARQSREVNVLGTKGLLTQLARCCKPVPGDQIIGYITRGRGATIHRQDCPNVLRLAEQERLIKVSWGQAQKTYPVSVRVTAYDRDGLTRDVSTVVAEEHINMSSVNVTTKNSIATFEVVMEVTDILQLSRVLTRIEQLPNVVEARRWNPG